MIPSDITFRHVPAGSITLRNARTGTARDVVLRTFQLAATPITVEQFGCTAGILTADRPAAPVTWLDAIRWCNAASPTEGLSPAYTIADDWVFWNPAADGYRLPTEAEWEFACRAGTAGPTYGPLSEIAWTEADGVESAQSVATKQPNDFDLYDMIGNVWEWCWDLADPARYGRYRSLRGGGWADPTWSCRVSVRRGSAPDAVIDDVGFRPARGTVGDPGATEAQGWSDKEDRARANPRGLVPFGWTPLKDFPTNSI